MTAALGDGGDPGAGLGVEDGLGIGASTLES
jgi:hypothetical protein